MNKIKILSILLLCLVATGCASVKYQEPVVYNATIPTEGKIIGIAANIPEKPKMTTPGASCLLCIAAAAAANSGLSSHTKTLNHDELKSLKTDLSEAFSANGYDVVEVGPVDLKQLKKTKDPIEAIDPVLEHGPLKESLKTTHLLLLDINYVGFIRDYSNYIPVSPPYSLISGKAYLVNLETNKYEWYLPIYEKNSVGQKWKEGPSYPGLTNSHYKGIATLRDKILSTFENKSEQVSNVSATQSDDTQSGLNN